MRYGQTRTYEHQCDFDRARNAQRILDDYREKWLDLRKEMRKIVKTHGFPITPELAKKIGLK